ncbi:restriction endonuclease subunit S [Arachidicoccus sp.]|uniref:restriction endonuclease subunit S n=1 Tax=Arachidicoccus sp. TaxID=1872624 RepID=UPI003D1AEBF7
MKTKSNNKRNVPNLRFKEFGYDWERKTLGEVFAIGNGRDYRHLDKGEIPVFGTGGIMTYVNSFLYDGETVCIGRKGTIDKPLYYKGKIWTVDTLFYTHSFISAVPKFVFYIFQLINWKEHNEASGVPSLSKKTIEEIEIHLPSLLEQQRIASFLSLIDGRIQTQNKIIENLKTQMLGLQEKIFRQKIKLKNSNGRYFPLWSFKKGGELFESISNKSHNSDLSILAITQVKGAVPRDLIDYQIMVTERSIESYKVVEIGDFIISLRSFQGGIEHSDYKGICSPAYIILRNKIEIMQSFYKYYFKTPDYIKLLNKKLEGIRDGKMISYSYFAEILIPFPELEEQKQIALFLSKTDQKIQTEKAILEQLGIQKKYLLQQMFV